MYKRFAYEYTGLSFTSQAKQDMYLYESKGVEIDNYKKNGYLVGKKWMDVTVSGWKEDQLKGHLCVPELLEPENGSSGFPEWFLLKVGVLRDTNYERL